MVSRAPGGRSPIGGLKGLSRIGAEGTDQIGSWQSRIGIITSKSVWDTDRMTV